MSDALGARRHWLIWVAATPLALWAIVRTFGLDGNTFLVPLMAFTPYAGIAALIVAVVAAALRNWAAALFAGLAMALIAVAVIPRAFGSAESAPIGSERLKILSANIAFGGAHTKAIMDLVRQQNPDLLAIQELKPEYVRNLRAQGIDRLLPYSIVSVRYRKPGLGIYSRLPIRRLSGFSLETSRVELTLPDGERLRIVDVHPHTPQFGQVGRWDDTLAGLPSAGSGAPWLLIGDFNATLDQAALRDVIDRGYRDAGATTGNGLEFTWPAEKSLPPLVTIDHVLADSRLGISEYGVDNLPGSDHHAIHATVFTPR